MSKHSELSVDENGFVYPGRTQPRNLYHQRIGVGPEVPPDQVQMVVSWLELFAVRRKRINPRINSYGCKHRVERWSGQYICNGAFIVAARALGFDAVPQSTGSPNAVFNFSIAKDAP